jgi:hypothetical protein
MVFIWFAPSRLYYHTSGFIAWFEFPPEHLVELIIHEHDPDIIARVVRILGLKLDQEAEEGLIVQGITTDERLNDVLISDDDKVAGLHVVGSSILTRS